MKFHWRCHFFGRHDWKTDPAPINGYLWRFCQRCAERQAGSYDGTYGETIWRRL
jgi:hypothetical protein